MVLRLMAAIGVLIPGGFAQVPPGPSYEAGLHPNEIVTFVETQDFSAATYEEAREMSGVELIGPSGDQGVRDGIELARARSLEIRVLGRRTGVLTFPVIHQTFRLADGSTASLYSFRQPRTDLPPQDAELMLNSDALGPGNSDEGRFGDSAPPDMVSIRGRPALLFTTDTRLTLFWQEDGICHVAVASIEEADLFRFVEDLL